MHSATALLLLVAGSNAYVSRNQAHSPQERPIPNQLSWFRAPLDKHSPHSFAKSRAHNIASGPLWNVLPARQIVTVTDLAVVYQTVTADVAATSTTQAAESADATSSSRRGGFRWWNQPEDQSETSSVEPTQTSTSATVSSTTAFQSPIDSIL